MRGFVCSRVVLLQMFVLHLIQNILTAILLQVPVVSGSDSHEDRDQVQRTYRYFLPDLDQFIYNTVNKTYFLP